MPRGGGRGGGPAAWRGRGGGFAGPRLKALALGDPRGHCGVFVCCDEGRERRAINEVADLLNDELDELYPRGTAAVAGGDGSAEGGEVRVRTLAEELADELAELGGGAGGGSAEGGNAAAAVATTAVPGAPRGFVDLTARFASKRARWMELDGRGMGLVWIDDGSLPLPASAISGGSVTGEGMEGDAEARGGVAGGGAASGTAGSASAVAVGDGAGEVATTSIMVAPPPPLSSPIDILRVTDAIFERILRAKELRTRYTSRLLPLQAIVPARSDAIVEAVSRLFSDAFPHAGGRSTTYRIELRARNTGALSKNDLFKECVGAIGGRHLVLLTDPVTTVLIEAVQNFCGIAVIPSKRWQRFERYNVRVCAETESDRARRLELSAEADAKGAKRKAAEAASGGVGAGGIGVADPSKRPRVVGEETEVTAIPLQKRVVGEEVEVTSPAVAATAAPPASGQEVMEPLPPIQHVSSACGGVFFLRMGEGGATAAVDVVSESSFLDVPHVRYMLAPAVASSTGGGWQMDVVHTFTPESLRGRGVGAALTSSALDWARHAGHTRVLASCTYTRAWASKGAAVGWIWDPETALLTMP